MWLKVGALLVWDALKWVFSGWFGKKQQERAIHDAVAPYKAEAEALAKPADTKHDNIERLRHLKP